MQIDRLRTAYVNMDVFGFLQPYILNICALPLLDRGLEYSVDYCVHAITRCVAHLVCFASKEYGPIADTQRAFLLLPLLVYFGDGPCLDIIRVGPCGRYAVGWIYVCAHWTRGLYDGIIR